MRAWKFLIFASILFLSHSLRAQLPVSSQKIEFGQVYVGFSKDTVIAINNLGCAPVSIFHDKLDSPFIIPDSNRILLGCDQSDSLHIVFKPSTIGFDSESFDLHLALEVSLPDTSYLLPDTSLKILLEGYGITAPADIKISQSETLNLVSYPNPATSSFEISYNLVYPCRAVLKLYDITGNDVATLSDGEEAAGPHSVAFNTNQYLGGAYLCLLRTTSANGIVSTNYCKVVIANLRR